MRPSMTTEEALNQIAYTAADPETRRAARKALRRIRRRQGAAR